MRWSRPAAGSRRGRSPAGAGGHATLCGVQWARLEELGLVMVEDGTITLDLEWRARLEEQSSLMPTHGNGGRRIVAEAWRLLASCHVAVEQAIRAGLPVPEWVRRRQTRAWADLERYAPMSPLTVPIMTREVHVQLCNSLSAHRSIPCETEQA